MDVAAKKKRKEAQVASDDRRAVDEAQAAKADTVEAAARKEVHGENRIGNGEVSPPPAFAKRLATLHIQQLLHLNVVIASHRPWMNNFVDVLTARKYFQ